jgi:hypothetical protein
MNRQGHSMVVACDGCGSCLLMESVWPDHRGVLCDHCFYHITPSVVPSTLATSDSYALNEFEQLMREIDRGNLGSPLAPS